MNFTGNIAPFLTDAQFDNSLEVRFSFDGDLGRELNRIQIIESFCKDQNVLHVGCCDHLPLIREKIENGSWLHKRLTDISNETLGVDINQEGIEAMKRLGFNNAICHDLLSGSNPSIDSKIWDIMVLGEILEHVNNPVDFLSSIRSNLKGKVKRILITVPNAFDIETIEESRKNIELINSDHRYWFTPYTLAKVGVLAGLAFTELHLSHDLSRSIGLRAKLMLFPFFKRYRRLVYLKKRPLARSTLIMIFEL